MNRLSPAAVGQAGHNVGAHTIHLNVLAKTIAQQPQFPTIDVTGLSNLNTHLATAQTHAESWLSTYSAQCWNLLQDISTAGETFSALYTSMHTAAKGLGDQHGFHPNQISTLVSELQGLQAVLQQPLQDAQTGQTNVTTYSSEVDGDLSAFKTDYQTAVAALDGSTGEIAELRQKIAADHSALHKDLGMIIGGPFMIMGGALMIAVGAFAEIETAGASTALMVGGVGLMAGGTAMVAIGAKNYDAMIGQLAQDQQTLATDQATMALLEGANGQFTGITTTLQDASSVLGDLVTSWQELTNGVGDVISALNDPESYLEHLRTTDPNATPATVSTILCAELSAAKADWEQAMTVVTALLAMGRNITYVPTTSAPTQDAIAEATGATPPPATAIAA